MRTPSSCKAVEQPMCDCRLRPWHRAGNDIGYDVENVVECSWLDRSVNGTNTATAVMERKTESNRWPMDDRPESTLRRWHRLVVDLFLTGKNKSAGECQAFSFDFYKSDLTIIRSILSGQFRLFHFAHILPHVWPHWNANRRLEFGICSSRHVVSIHTCAPIFSTISNVLARIGWNAAAIRAYFRFGCANFWNYCWRYSQCRSCSFRAIFQWMTFNFKVNLRALIRQYVCVIPA